jgi:hypothetical protein
MNSNLATLAVMSNIPFLRFDKKENHGGVCCKPTDRRKIATVI